MPDPTYTPLPWTTDDGFVVGADGTMVCTEVSRSLIRQGIAEANARLIVRAVNSHEELLAACEAALPWLHAEATTAHDCRTEFVPECRLCCVRKQVADAIASGKGELR